MAHTLWHTPDDTHHPMRAHGVRPGNRPAPPPLRSFTLGSDGADAHRIRKLCRLLVFVMGPPPPPHSSSSHSSAVAPAAAAAAATAAALVAVRVERLLNTLRPYIHPSNSGGWSARLGMLLSGLSCEVH